jgi:hypothetical protein
MDKLDRVKTVWQDEASHVMISSQDPISPAQLVGIAGATTLSPLGMDGGSLIEESERELELQKKIQLTSTFLSLYT